MNESLLDITVSYSDFLKLCNVDDPADWLPCLRVAIDGVWLISIPDDLPVPAETRAELSRHPDGDPTSPVLRFPTTIGEIKKRINDFYCGQFIDPFDMAAFVANACKRHSKETKPTGIRETNTLLAIIGCLLNLMLSKTPAGKPASVYYSQTSIINALVNSNTGVPGISKRTLEAKFVAAKKVLGLG